MVSTNCCSALDHVLTLVFKRLQKKSTSSGAALPVTPLEQTMQLRPEIMQRVIGAEVRGHWWFVSRLSLLFIDDGGHFEYNYV